MKSKVRSIYVPPEIEGDVNEFAKNEGRSFNQMIVRLLTESIKSAKTGEPVQVKAGENLSFLPEEMLVEVKEFADKEDRPVEQMVTILLQQAIKEKKRLRDKYLKSINK